MSDEIQLISDDNGLAIIGPGSAVELLLTTYGLESRDLPPARLANVIGGAGNAGQAAARIAVNSGRWMQITEKSARQIKQIGLMKSTETGLSLGVIKASGKSPIRGLVEFSKGPQELGSIVGNPAALGSVAGMMSQYTMLQMIE